MHREWVQISVVVGLMTGFGLGAATVALASLESSPETVMWSLAGGILFGTLVGVAIVFSQAQPYGYAKERVSAARPFSLREQLSRIPFLADKKSPLVESAGQD
jgi:hypothetical protein